jgi:hypothetical protein
MQFTTPMAEGAISNIIYRDMGIILKYESRDLYELPALSCIGIDTEGRESRSLDIGYSAQRDV